MKKEKNLSNYLKIIISGITILMGICLMKSPLVGLSDPIFYFSLFFLGLGFINLSFHFFSKERNYELLMISINNFIIGIFLLIFKSQSSPMFLGISITVYTFIDFLIRGYIITKKRAKNYIEWATRLIEMIGLVFLGCLISNNIYHEQSVLTLIFGFYFVVYGIITLISSFAIIVGKKIKENDKTNLKLEENIKLETQEPKINNINPKQSSKTKNTTKNKSTMNSVKSKNTTKTKSATNSAKSKNTTKTKSATNSVKSKDITKTNAKTKSTKK